MAAKETDGAGPDARQGATTAMPSYRSATVILLVVQVLNTMLGQAQVPFMPEKMSQMGCDALCLGQLTSASSAVGLIGSLFVGRASDLVGRKAGLWLSMLGAVCSVANFAWADTVTLMWIFALPVNLFAKQHEVTKAIFADLSQDESVTERVGIQGILGMASGLGVLGGGIGMVVNTREGVACVISGLFAMTVALLLLLPQLPSPQRSISGHSGLSSGGMLSLPVLRRPGSILLLTIRLFMATAFSMFNVIVFDLLRKKFNYGPSEFSVLMASLGAAYSLGQGLLAKPALRMAGARPELMLGWCCAVIPTARITMLYLTHPGQVHAVAIPLMLAIAILNCAVNGAASVVALPEEVGTLYGLNSSMEAAAGILGPLLGGVAWRFYDDLGVAIAAASCYLIVLPLIILGWTRAIVPPGSGSSEKKQKAA